MGWWNSLSPSHLPLPQERNAPRKKPLMHCERDIIGRRRKDSQQEKCKIDLTDKRRKGYKGNYDSYGMRDGLRALLMP
jgi:hypothetical protein